MKKCEFFIVKVKVATSLRVSLEYYLIGTKVN